LDLEKHKRNGSAYAEILVGLGRIERELDDKGLANTEAAKWLGHDLHEDVRNLMMQIHEDEEPEIEKFYRGLQKVLDRELEKDLKEGRSQ